uniref:Transposase n=1 Tax=Vespula pensylvanica TaxID=30213 RepID=A0A834K8D2_VESPE|nr:hypothetical protein H0235_015981 [Vespula pensylvanica]
MTVWWNVNGKIHCSWRHKLENELGITANTLIKCQYANTSSRQRSTATTTSQHMIIKLIDLKYEILQHPPHSSDRLSTYYHFFKQFELFLRNKYFENEERSLSTQKTKTFLRKALKIYWEKCIEVNEAYFD